MCEALLVSAGVGASTAAAIAAAAPWVAAGTTLATGIYSGAQGSAAATKSANAIRDQNTATMAAQNLAFNQRINATRAQSDAQADTARRELAARTTSALSTNAARDAALTRQNTVLGAENDTASQLRDVGDQRARDLLAATSRPALDQSQTGYQDDQAASLTTIQAPGATGPVATDPSGSGAMTTSNDPATKQAFARRMGIAAANIRQYGADIARVASYGQPMVTTGQAITANQTGIMPAQTADTLLRGGSAVRLLPSQTAYAHATDYGRAEDTAIQAKAAGENTYSGLAFGNTTGAANLGQSDADTRAANTARQATSDADWQKQVAGLIQGIGNLGAYGAGLYGPNVLPRPKTATVPA
jgi:hypothetical protein